MTGVDKAVELIKAFTPLITAATPVLLVLAATFQWWITHRQARDLKAATAQQTADLMAHSDKNRDDIKGTVTSTTGTHRQLEG